MTTTIRRPKGAGTIRNRGTERAPRWQALYSVTGDGKRRQVTETFARKGDAERWLKAELRRKEEGTSPDPTRRRMTVAELLAEWLAVRRNGGGLARNTAAEYHRIIRLRLVPHLGRRKLDALRPGHVTDMLEALRQPGANHRGRRIDGHGHLTVPSDRGLSPTSLQHTLGVLSSALGWAVKQGYVARNVCDAVERPKRIKAKPAVWDGDEIARFLAYVEDDRLAALWRLAAFTGARRSELLGLRWDAAVDLVAGTVKIERRALRVGYQMVDVEGTKTTAGERTIDLDPGTVAALRRWAKAQKAERLAWGPAYTDSGYVFTTEDGRPVHADHVANRFRRLVRDAGLRPIRFHDLRHSHASVLLDAGEPMFDIAKRLGHSSVQMLISTYGHALDGRGKRTASRFAQAVEGNG